MNHAFSAVLSLTLLCGCGSSPITETESTAAPDTGATPAITFADNKYVEYGRHMMHALEDGNMEAYLDMFDSSAIYRWNNGDSLAGKAAIARFWKKRRMEVVSSVKFKNEIWLPTCVNRPQSIEQPGVWLLGWAQVDVMYANGKPMSQWMHFSIHFNNHDRVDQMMQYVDMLPIHDAMPPGK